MAEQTLKGTPSGSSAGQRAPRRKPPRRACAAPPNRRSPAGREIKDKVSDLASSSAETIKQQASEFAGAAKDFAAQASDRIKERVADQAGMGADFVGNLADTMRRAAREFDTDLPIAAQLHPQGGVAGRKRVGFGAQRRSAGSGRGHAILCAAAADGVSRPRRAGRLRRGALPEELRRQRYAIPPGPGCNTDDQGVRSHERQQRPFDS